MRMIKVGDKYLGLVDRQGDALRFDEACLPVVTLADIASAIGGGRIVKLKTIADRTADSMRGLADDVIGSDPDPINPMPSDDGEK